MKQTVALKYYITVCIALCLQYNNYAQNVRTLTKDAGIKMEGENQYSNFDSQGRPLGNRAKKGTDSLQKRNSLEDSITIYYRNFNNNTIHLLDSGINDFSKRFAQPYGYNNLGNYGTAAQSLIFNPILKAGWDAGFHQFDVYNYSLEDTRFFQTTRPYTELAYILGNKSEQTINVLHTQNKKSNFNFTFQYRFINAPGTYKNQNNNHNNTRFNLCFNTPNKRYAAYFIWIANKNVSSENGGLRNINKLDSLALNNPYELETRLGASGLFSQNPFNTSISTGNIYKQNTFLLKHYYDFGQKDSIVTDSSTIQLFYPRFRIEHSITLNHFNFNFIDNNIVDSNYKHYFGFQSNTNLIKTAFQNSWNNTNHQLSFITFPEKNNLNQYLKLGVVVQTLRGTYGINTFSDYNLYLTAEYKNTTKNKIWDIDASGEFFINGFNAGNYEANISLKRIISKRLGSLQLGFKNVNKTPAFIFTNNNNYLLKNNTVNTNENTIQLFANYQNANQTFKLSGNYYVVNNYVYFDSFFSAKQTAQMFHVLHIAAEKQFKLIKHLNWYTQLHVQQTTANAPLHVPNVLTRNRIAFEGNFFTNLFLSTGLEIKYYTNYKANNYSPFTGQFFYQTTFTTANRPELNAFFHFRIKSFKAYIRLENLNTLIEGTNKYNINAPNYASNTLWFRTGIYWNFIN